MSNNPFSVVEKKIIRDIWNGTFDDRNWDMRNAEEMNALKILIAANIVCSVDECPALSEEFINRTIQDWLES